MLTFTYEARDPSTGQKIKSSLEADNEQAAAKLIRDQGYAPLEIKLKQEGGQGLGKLVSRVKTKDKIIFSCQLSTLINAGLPLVQSLRSVQEQTTNKNFSVIINKIIADVESGTSFSATLAKHPDIFNQVYISLIAAGEASGTLDQALERIALQQEKDAEIISKVRGAMVYPLIVIVVMIGVVTFMLVSVLPQVQNLYKGIPGAQLPILTRALLVVSNAIIQWWWLLIILIIGGGFATSKWARTLGGKRVIDKAKMHFPAIGPLFMKLYMARFARTATTLVASGVPLIQVLEITAKAIDNFYIEASLRGAIEKVKGGKSLSSALEKDPNFLPLVPNMLKIGEQSGAIETMLAKTADYFEKEVDNEVKTISTIIEPLLMVLIGGMALIIVAAVLLPIYSLVGKDVIH